MSTLTSYNGLQVVTPDPTGMGGLAINNNFKSLSGSRPQPVATVATTGALPSNTYSNGSSGVGATLTATATGTLIVDGHTVALNDLVLVKNESTAANNGLYLCTTAGATGVAYVLTRNDTMDSGGDISGALALVGTAGTANANTVWVANPSGTVTVGTTAIPFLQIAASVTGVVAPANGGTGVANSYTITLGGNVVTAGALTTSGAYGITITATATTSVTLPTTGTLLSSALENQAISFTDTSSSGTAYGLQITPTLNQTSTAAATDLLINRTETAVGSGTQYLINAQVGGVSKFSVDHAGTATATVVNANIFQTGYASSPFAYYGMKGPESAAEAWMISSKVVGGEYFALNIGATSGWEGISFYPGSANEANLFTSGSFFIGPTDSSSGPTGMYGFQIAPTYSQSGTADATDLLINRTETSVGSGNQYLIDAQVNSTSKFTVDHSGNVIAGTWQGSILAANYGGTGVNNGSYTMQLGGNVALSGALSTGGALTLTGSYSTTITVTGATSVTLPTTGTLLSSTAATMASALDMGTNAINNVVNPTNPQDAATKNYVDASIQGLQVKSTATVATTAALPSNTYSNGSSGVGATLTATATGTLTVDGHTVALNDLILVKNESSSANNGLYLCTTAGATGVAYVLTRSVEMDVAADFPGAFVPVGNVGTANANSLWLANPSGTVTVGTTAIPFTQLNGATQLTAGTGISISGNTISVVNGVYTTGSYSNPAWITSISGSIVSGNISGNAANVTGTVAIANGGTGQATASAGFNALSPVTTLGDVIYGSGANAASRLAGNTTTTKKFLNQTGTGSVSAAPAWGTIAVSDLPTIFASVTAPSSVSAAFSTYNGMNQYVTWQIDQGDGSPTSSDSGAVIAYNVQVSTDNSTWKDLAGTTGKFSRILGNTFQSPSFSSGNQYAQVQAVNLTASGTAGSTSSWIGSSAVAYSQPPYSFLANSIVSTTTIANTTTNTTGYTYTIPANQITAGTVIRLTISGLYAIASSSTIAYQLEVGGNSAMAITKSAVTSSTTGFRIVFEFTCRTAGSSGTGFAKSGAVFGTDIEDGNPTSTFTINTTVSNAVAVLFQWGVANSGNTLTVEQAFLEQLTA